MSVLNFKERCFKSGSKHYGFAADPPSSPRCLFEVYLKMWFNNENYINVGKEGKIIFFDLNNEANCTSVGKERNKNDLNKNCTSVGGASALFSSCFRRSAASKLWDPEKEILFSFVSVYLAIAWQTREKNIHFQSYQILTKVHFQLAYVKNHASLKDRCFKLWCIFLTMIVTIVTLRILSFNLWFEFPLFSTKRLM